MWAGKGRAALRQIKVHRPTGDDLAGRTKETHPHESPLIVRLLALTCALGPVVQTANAQPDRRPRVAGLFGFVLGAALAESREEHRDRIRLEDREWIAACARRYRSFDARSGAYLGRDGLRHYCRL